MEHLWAPVGTGVRPQAETDFVVAWLFGDADGQVAVKEMDATIGELPGLAGTAIFAAAASKAARRAGGRPGL